MDSNDIKDFKDIGKFIFICIVAIIGIWISLATVVNFYRVWSEGKAGQAEIARAEYNRKIKTLEAEAAMESSKYLAESEIIRARGVAEANKIIGDSLAGNESYLRYLWIQNLNHDDKTVVYVPTEANLPVLEAGKR